MKAPAKVKVLSPTRDDRPTLQRLLVESENRHARATTELAECEAGFTAASSALDDVRASGASAVSARQAVKDSEIDLASARRVERKTFEQVEKARAALGKLEAELDAEELDRCIATVKGFSESVAQRAEGLVSLDKQVDEWVAAQMRDFVKALDAYERGEELASRRRLTARLDQACKAPSLPNFRLELARVVTQARLDEGRDAVAPQFLAHVTRDMAPSRAFLSAEQLAAADSHRDAWQRRTDDEARNAAVMSAVAAGVQIAGGAVVPNPGPSELERKAAQYTPIPETNTPESEEVANA